MAKDALTLWDEDVVADKRRAEEAKQAAIQFESRKSHYRQSKEGITLSLVLNPHDAPPEIILAPIGQRFLCVLVPIDDHDEPVVSKEKRDIEEWIRLCGIMCNDTEFQTWLVDQGLCHTVNADDAAQAIRDHCGVSSRAQFRDDPDALEKWKMIHHAYIHQGTL